MSISIYKIKKWYKMMTGKSISHVNQGVGSCYSKTEIAGYYNDLTEKVTKDDPNILIPQYNVDTGEKIYFSIGVFQYGLASYDLFLKTKEDGYKKKFLACAEWAVQNQQENGSWVTFAYKSLEKPYSAMAQGEAISLLVRCYIFTGNKAYLIAATKAKDFMLKPIEEGGTAEYKGNDLCLYECTFEPLILNGWIFSLWGLFDYYKLTKDGSTKNALDATLQSLHNKLPLFDAKYWSNYDICAKRISSPFYHKLHIAQLKTMYDLFDDPIYRDYANKWEKYQTSFWKQKQALAKKIIQKILEK